MCVCVCGGGGGGGGGGGVGGGGAALLYNNIDGDLSETSCVIKSNRMLLSQEG